MKHKSFFSMLAACILLMPAIAANKGGVDSYEIYLNNKLLTRQSVIKPLALKNLSLDASNMNDELVIYYSHCGAIGKGRKIAIRDGDGNIVKEWKFADVSSSDKGMTIPVKELMQLQKQHAKTQLSIFYTSQELPQGRLLTGVQFSGKSNT